MDLQDVQSGSLETLKMWKRERHVFGRHKFACWNLEWMVHTSDMGVPAGVQDEGNGRDPLPGVVENGPESWRVPLPSVSWSEVGWVGWCVCGQHDFGKWWSCGVSDKSFFRETIRTNTALIQRARNTVIWTSNWSTSPVIATCFSRPFGTVRTADARSHRVLSVPFACGNDVRLGNLAVDVDVDIDGARCAGMAAADHRHQTRAWLDRAGRFPNCFRPRRVCGQDRHLIQILLSWLRRGFQHRIPLRPK